jgi:hypothetical protein
VHAALEIVGALGVHSPSEVRREHLFRRESGMLVADFAALQGYMAAITEPGILLHDDPAVAPQLAHWWKEGKRIHQQSRQV